MDHKEDEKTSFSSRPTRNNTLRLSQEFNEKYFSELKKNIEITDFTVMKDDIKNYKPLNQ